MRTLPKNLGKTLDPQVIAFQALQDVAQDLSTVQERRIRYIEHASLVGVKGTDIARALGIKEASVRGLWDRAGK